MKIQIQYYLKIPNIINSPTVSATCGYNVGGDISDFLSFSQILIIFVIGSKITASSFTINCENGVLPIHVLTKFFYLAPKIYFFSNLC